MFAPGSWEQLFWLTLLPQLVIWPAFTVLTGIAAGALALLLSVVRSPLTGQSWTGKQPGSDPAPHGESPVDAPGGD